MVEDRGVVFAKHRGLGFLFKTELTGVSDIESFRTGVARIVLASVR